MQQKKDMVFSSFLTIETDSRVTTLTLEVVVYFLKKLELYHTT